MVVGQGISRLVNNVIQGGIDLDPDTTNADINEQIKDRWKEETSDERLSCTGELTWNQQQKLVCRHVLVDGDILAITLDNDTIQLAEAHRLRTPNGTARNVVHGILFDKDGVGIPREYWVTKEDISPFSVLANVSSVTKIPAKDAYDNKQVFHVFNPKRISQHRGVTVLAPVALPVGLHDDIQLAKLVQQQSASMIAILTSRQPGIKYSQRGKKGEQRAESFDDGTVKTIEGVPMGLHFTPQPGESLTGFSPNIPNPEFFQHATMILSLIAINLDLPLIVFLLDASETNFSGWRGAMDQAKIGFRAIQDFLVSKFHRNVYLWRLRRWMETDANFSADVAKAENSDKKFRVTDHHWNPKTWPYVQPVEDATAALLRRHGLLISPRRLAAENSLDWASEVISETVADNKEAWVRAIEGAREVNSLLGSGEESWKVSPGDLLSLPLPDTVRLNLQNQPKTVEPKANAGRNGKAIEGVGLQHTQGVQQIDLMGDGK